MIYQVQHSHILQVEASDPPLVSPLMIVTESENTDFRVFKILFIKYPQYHRLEFTEQHYTTVADYFMTYFLDPQ